ncbi:hypothetical protein LOTGIDRAFT_117771 [Lottia gigantea]|uniref:Uncharacterized protein n=1 Tax=Lottia gigantea TaxID=225164 RepID=V4AMB0_LOTGI|nr:hypothetical protein LOTGIDRAFT_117771 [Lottia gigantea]ESO94756.1 hypothetical protein LOTGIDRAFT_117771 [Lottia gigantea]
MGIFQAGISCKIRENVFKRILRFFQAVTHPSTNRARHCLTSVIGRELVLSTWYGRRHSMRIFLSGIYRQTP